MTLAIILMRLTHLEEVHRSFKVLSLYFSCNISPESTLFFSACDHYCVVNVGFRMAFRNFMKLLSDRPGYYL